MNSDFLELNKKYSERAQLVMDKIKTGKISSFSEDELSSLVLEFTRLKYMLEPSECGEDSFEALGQCSIAKVAKIPKGDVKTQDLSMNCAGISSVETKKILLIITIQKQLGLKIDPDKVPEITTTAGLSKELLNAAGKEV